MPFAFAKPSRALKLRGADAPNYRDFSTPHDGDYVRYVDALMQWAEQEQARMRLQVLGEKALSNSDSQWGRRSAPSNVGASSTPSVSRRNFSASDARSREPGSVDSAVERWKRKAKVRAAQVSRNVASAASPKSNGVDKRKIWQFAIAIALLSAFLLIGDWLPAGMSAIVIAWLVLHQFQSVRRALR